MNKNGCETEETDSTCKVSKQLTSKWNGSTKQRCLNIAMDKLCGSELSVETVVAASASVREVLGTVRRGFSRAGLLLQQLDLQINIWLLKWVEICYFSSSKSVLGYKMSGMNRRYEERLGRSWETGNRSGHARRCRQRSRTNFSPQYIDFFTCCTLGCKT